MTIDGVRINRHDQVLVVTLDRTSWSFLRVRSKTIAGGTSEVLRNILGERTLGLPKEPEVDRSVPWSKARRS